ncbi:hypothetical protein GGD55_003120 [Rhizobium giardinii]|uniref:Uncharacterized protein n=1 Tax=Rhizobium giardinii TaxID=56731 RepID=A0A7W8UBT8_9HYPH|nr:hypothetical protein [Rhizobium giardinii]
MTAGPLRKRPGQDFHEKNAGIKLVRGERYEH